MDILWTDVALLLVAGAAGGFIGGLVGVGGGLIFAPVLLFYFQAAGVPPEHVTPLTIGTSLFCTLIVALSSARSQYQRKTVSTRVAISVGLSSAVAVVLMTSLVTTQPWYDANVFQIVFSALLLVVAFRMVRPLAGAIAVERHGDPVQTPRPLAWFATGTSAGVISSAVGVGGGIVMVPIYNNLLHMPIRRAVGTSSATMVLVSLAGILSYLWIGWDLAATDTAVGFVDVPRALLLSVPALFTARYGVHTAHRVDRVILRRSFAVVAMIVAVMILFRALG